MNTTSSTKKRTGIIVLVVGLLLVAVAGFATYSINTTEPETSTGPDIEPGDIVSDINPLTGVPLSGTWSFKLDIGNPGTAELQVSPSGSYIAMQADGQNLFFYTTSSTVPYTYKTNDRWFQLRDAIDLPVDGYAYFEFTAIDDDVIDGVVHHDTYPSGGGERYFHMELIEAELPDNEWFLLTQGDWEIEYNEPDSDCEDGAASFPDLETDITVEIVYDLDTGEATNEVQVDFDGDTVYFEPGDDANAYNHSGVPLDAGTPSDADGDIMLDYENDTFDANYEFYGVDEGLVEGYVDITSSNGCGYSIGFTATYIGN